MSSADTGETRARVAARRAWPLRLVALGSAEQGSLDRSTTPEERLEMVWTLTLEAWALSRRPVPSYTRASSPLRLCRRDPPA
jgi:hypothetical protein